MDHRADLAFIIFRPVKGFPETGRLLCNDSMGIQDDQTASRRNQKGIHGSTIELNARGDDGWELAATIDYTGGGTKYLVFKRSVNPAAGGDGETSP